jgi:hypothetical protein
VVCGQEANDKESFPLIKSCNRLQTLLNSSAVNKNRDSLFSGQGINADSS